MWGGAPNAGLGGFPTFHRFGHHSGRHNRSGRASTAKIHVFLARLFRQVSKSRNTQYYHHSQAELDLGTGMGLLGGLGTGMGFGDENWGRALGTGIGAWCSRGDAVSGNKC